MKTPTASEYYKEATAYVEKYHGTRADRYIEEGDVDRMELKAALLDEYVAFREELARIAGNFPAISAHGEVQVHFPQ